MGPPRSELQELAVRKRNDIFMGFLYVGGKERDNNARGDGPGHALWPGSLVEGSCLFFQYIARDEEGQLVQRQGSVP